MRIRPVIFLSVLLAGTTGTSAQSGRGQWSLGPYVGGSFDSAVGNRWGITPGRQSLFVGLHARVPLVERPRWSFNWAPELVPLLIVTHNPRYETQTDAAGGKTFVELTPAPVAGFGFAPIGLEAQGALRSRVRAYGAGALGGLIFTRNTPVVDARKFNFTAEFGGGLLWRIHPRLWLRTGYKFHHFSNAKTAPNNPGVDAHVFYLGMERMLASRRHPPGTR